MIRFGLTVFCSHFVLPLAVALLFTALICPTARAEIPQTVSYQGVLENIDGSPVNDSLSITFRIYDAEQSGVALWSQVQVVDVDNGLLAVELGGQEALFPPTLFTQPLWLGIQVETTTELSPRQPLGSVPYAFQSQNAALLEGFVAFELDQSDHVAQTDNPHGVTADQVGALTETAIESQYYTRANLDAMLANLTAENTLLQQRIELLEAVDLSAQLQALQEQVAILQEADNTAASLMQFVTVDGTDITFAGANLHIVNGLNEQNLPSGAGNLTIGYNPVDAEPIMRGGSHNLILGEDNNYAGTGAIVSGTRNLSDGENASIIGGFNNEVTGTNAAVIGGAANMATGFNSVAVGGSSNSASGGASAIVGGKSGIAAGTYSLQAGGTNNQAQGWGATTAGGAGGVAGGAFSLVAGGEQNSTPSSDPGNVNLTESKFAVVMGGRYNEAQSQYSMIAGGEFNRTEQGDSGTRGVAAAVVGGTGNVSSGNGSLVAGGAANSVESNINSALIGDHATVIGGGDNRALGRFSAVFGGRRNTVQLAESNVVGGNDQSDMNPGETIIPNPALATLRVEFDALSETFNGVSRSGDQLYFDGMNLHIRNGAGATASNNGRGNFVVGYNELRPAPLLTVRTGSHNLIIGDRHGYSNHSMIVHGSSNGASSAYGAIIGSISSDISFGSGALVLGGLDNRTQGESAVVLGGRGNDAGRDFSSIRGKRFTSTDN